MQGGMLHIKENTKTATRRPGLRFFITSISVYKV